MSSTYAASDRHTKDTRAMAEYQYTPNDIKRFWSYVDMSVGMFECWLWTGGITSAGYGAFWFHGRTLGAHRISWELAHGEILNNLFLCHHCDNPRCVNPTHLFLGTQRDNVLDCFSKGRRIVRRGKELPYTKLTEANVQEIRQRYAIGNITQQKLADEFGVTLANINGIIHRTKWKHVK